MIEFFKNLLWASGTCAIMILLLMVSKPVLKNKISRLSQYALWLIIIFRMLIPFSIGNYSLINLTAISDNVGMYSTNSLPLDNSSQSMSPSVVDSVNNAISSVTQNLFYRTDSVRPLNYFFDFLFVLWFAVAFLLLGISAISYSNYLKKIRNSRVSVSDDRIVNIFDECLTHYKIKNKIQLYRSPCVKTPILYGVFKYSVILPKKSLDAVQLRHSFLHELAHYKHRDNFVKWIVLLALRLHWFNPFVYKAANEIDLLCELRCDESATKCFSESERLDYGKTLLTVASNSLREPFSVFSSFGEDKQNLKERLEVLINMKSKKSSTLFVSFVAIALTAILAVFSLTACKTNTDQKTNINSHSPSNDSTSISKQFEQESTPSSQTVSTVSINPADKKQIIDNVSDELKEKYPDINVTNQWLGNKEENRYTVLFGCLKNDPQQGVAQVILESADGKNILEEKRYLDPMKNGALKVTDLESAKDDFMKIGDSTGKQRSFSCRSGFTLY